MQEKIALKGKEKGGGGDKQALFYTTPEKSPGSNDQTQGDRF